MQAHVISNPAGTFSIVGFQIPISLCYARRDGAPLTDEDIDRIRHCGIIGNMRETFKSVTFATAAAAQTAIDNWTAAQ